MTLQPVSFKKGRAHAPRLSKPRVPGRHADRFWTAPENEIIRKHYPKGGVAACALRLPQHHSSKSSIYQQAAKLGVRSAKPCGGKRQRHDYGPEMDARIREAWPQLDTKRKGVVNELADRLGVPRWWLSRRARQLGLEIVVHKKEPPWTAAEDALLKRVPLHDPERAAEIFREHGFARTGTAIVVRATRLKLSRRATHPTLSGTQAAKILGVDNKTLCTWCLKGWLRATRRKDQRLPQQGGSA